ncbi:hypothetical protein ACHAWX_000080 [Stephanocyclus meneghinianus]
MGIGDWWNTTIGPFKKENYVSISKFVGKTCAVDISILLCACTAADIDKLTQRSTPPHPAPDLLHKIQTVQNSLAQHINAIYVYDGFAPLHKKWKQYGWHEKCEKNREVWTSLLQKPIDNLNKTINVNALKDALITQMRMKHPNSIDHASVVRWMKENSIPCVGLIAEADQQMIKLRKMAL